MTDFRRPGTSREQIDAARAHPAADSSWPPAPISSRTRQPSLTELAPHVARALGGAVSGAKTRIAAALAVWGTISTMGSAGFAFLMSQQRSQEADRMARIEASIRELQHSVDGSVRVLEATSGTLTPRVVELERASKTHGELLAVLQQQRRVR